MDNKFESIITESRKRQLELFGKKKKNKDTKTKSSSNDTQEKLDINDIESLLRGTISSDLQIRNDDTRLVVCKDDSCKQPIKFDNNFKSIYNKLEDAGFNDVVRNNTGSTYVTNGSAGIVLKNKAGQKIRVSQGYNDEVDATTAISIYFE